MVVVIGNPEYVEATIRANAAATAIDAANAVDFFVFMGSYGRAGHLKQHL